MFWNDVYEVYDILCPEVIM